MLSVSINTWSLAQYYGRSIAHDWSQGRLDNLTFDKTTLISLRFFQFLDAFFIASSFSIYPIKLWISTNRLLLVLHRYEFSIYLSIDVCFVQEATLLPELALILFHLLKGLKNLQLLRVTQQLCLIRFHWLNASSFKLILDTLLIDRQFTNHFMDLINWFTVFEICWRSHLKGAGIKVVKKTYFATRIRRRLIIIT